MKKDTSRIVEELKECSDFRSFYGNLKKEGNVSDRSLSDCLSELFEAKGLSRAEVIKKSEMSEIYAYQIISGIKRPERKKLLALTVGMELGLEETQRLLTVSGYPELYVKNTFDCIVMYGICKKKTVMDINEMLYDYGEPTIG